MKHSKATSYAICITSGIGVLSACEVLHECAVYIIIIYLFLHCPNISVPPPWSHERQSIEQHRWAEYSKRWVILYNLQQTVEIIGVVQQNSEATASQKYGVSLWTKRKDIYSYRYLFLRLVSNQYLQWPTAGSTSNYSHFCFSVEILWFYF